MWTAYDVLTLLACLLSCLLLLSDVRDELLRACKPFLLRALENAGVLTRDDYERRAGLRADAKQEQLKGASAAGAFARGVAAEQRAWQQHDGASSSGASAGLSINASLPSPAASSSSFSSSSSHSNGSSALSAPAPGSGLMTSPDRKSQRRASAATPLAGDRKKSDQADASVTPASHASVDAAMGGSRLHPLDADRGQFNGHSLDDELEAAAAEHKDVRSESRSSRSRNKTPSAQQQQQQQLHAQRKSIIVSPSNQVASPVQAPLAISVEQPQPAPTPLASASTVAAAAAGSSCADDSRRPSPALTAAASMNAGSTAAGELDLSMDRHEGNGREISISQRGVSTRNQPSLHAAPSQFGPHSAYAAWLQAQQAAAAAGVAASLPSPAAIPLIAGVPLTSLTLLRSSDCGVPTEEYYSLLTGEKVAWRRGNIWDSDFIYTLTQGLELMKYGSWGRPHIRKIRFVLVPNTDAPAANKDKDGSAPGSSSPASGPQVALDWGSGYILLSEVTSISKGKTGSVFKRFAKDASIDEATCLSVVTPKRSLDLQVLSTKQQRMQEKRDLLAYGLGEVTGTRRMEDKDELTAAQRRKIVSASSSRPAALALPIPLQKIVESINTGAASAAGGGGLERYARRGVLGNGIIAGSNSIPLSAIGVVGSPSVAGNGTVSLAAASAREKEYSLSTQRSQAQPYQSSVPSTPSVSHQHIPRSAQPSPAAAVVPPPALFVPGSSGAPTPLASPQAGGGPGSVRHGSIILPSAYGTGPLSAQHRGGVMTLPTAGAAAAAGSHSSASYNHSIALMQQQHMMQQQQLQLQQQLAQRQLLYAQQANAAAAVAAAAAAASHHPHHSASVVGVGVGVGADYGSTLPPPHFPPVVSPLGLYAPGVGVVGVSPVAGVGVGGAHGGYVMSSDQAQFDELMRNQQLLLGQTHVTAAANAQQTEHVAQPMR